MKIQLKTKSGETSVVGTVIAAVCIVIYLVALVQAAVRFYLTIDQRKIQSDLEFEYIADLALVAGAQGFMSQAYIETINNALAASRTIEALIISGPDGEYAFERQRGNAVTWVNNSPRFINKLGLSNQGLHKSLPIGNLRNVYIQASTGIFNYAEISKILKETLILILTGFTIAFFTMLIQLLTSKPAVITSEVEEETHIPVTEQDEPEPVENDEVENVEDEIENIEVENTDIDELEIYEEEPGPKGLYSPRSNIGWEEYTKDRLDSELHRCSSTEKDLALLAIEFTDKINNFQFKEAAEEAASFFTSRDLLFERGEQGITVIVPGIGLETGLAKAEKFHQRIREKIFFNHNADDCIFTGLSSRSGRLLNAERMLLEVNEAVQRAKTDSDTSIIAFKSNLEKYREFVLKKG